MFFGENKKSPEVQAIGVAIGLGLGCEPAIKLLASVALLRSTFVSLKNAQFICWA